MSERSQVRVSYTKSGLRRYSVEVRHRELNKFQVITGDNEYVVEQKARVKMADWDEMWARGQEAEQKRIERERQARDIEQKKQLAQIRTIEAQQALAELEQTLAHTLPIDDTINWMSLKDTSEYGVPKPQPSAKPQPPAQPSIPREPQRSDPRYNAEVDFFTEFLDGIFTSRRVDRKKEMDARFKREHTKWAAFRDRQVSEYNEQLAKHKTELSGWEVTYKAILAKWEKGQRDYIQARDARNRAVDEKQAAYQAGDPQAIVDYCDLVLTRSEYPDEFPQSFELDYNPENKMLLVDYQLPAVSDLPTLQEVKYIQSRDEFSEKHVSQTQLNRNYDNLLYQIALRTIHELYEADAINAIASIVFNGFVQSIDAATGHETNPCVLSVQASKEEFTSINLANVDPKACFKMLKGVGSSTLHSRTPIAPIIQMDRDDKRFVEAHGVVDTLREGDNLAAMDWEEFEHLVRELFEKEFSGTGGEVKVTRASRDGGIDAVVFDPDPIRGGKIVIQAKRYTNTVGVAAVRDLYGTVINEGANKGILVTTSDYGPDAYEFIKGKPLVLLSGSNLLHLLEKHGHKAWIDLKEAKRELSDR
jgi:restriction system protein